VAAPPAEIAVKSIPADWIAIAPLGTSTTPATTMAKTGQMRAYTIGQIAPRAGQTEKGGATVRASKLWTTRSRGEAPLHGFEPWTASGRRHQLFVILDEVEQLIGCVLPVVVPLTDLAQDARGGQDLQALERPLVSSADRGAHRCG